MSESRPVFAALTRGTHVLGVAMIVLGVLAMLTPALAGAPMVILLGLLVTVGGLVLAVFGWRAWSAGKGVFGLLAGGLAVVCGLALLFNPVSTLETVSTLVAIYLVIGGASALVTSSGLGDDEGRAWVWADALLSIALGVSMWVGWPFSGLRALGILIGVRFVSAGAVLLRVERGMQQAAAGAAALRSRLASRRE